MFNSQHLYYEGGYIYESNFSKKVTDSISPDNWNFTSVRKQDIFHKKNYIYLLKSKNNQQKV